VTISLKRRVYMQGKVRITSDPVASSGTVAADPRQYAPSPGLSGFPLGNTSELIYCPFDRTRHVLSAAEATVLRGCESFATLEEHAQRHLDLGKFDAMAVQSALQRLVDARLLVAKQDLVARCLTREADNQPPATIASVCIPTRNRPDMLRRCVESYIQCARQFSRCISFVIVDSSDDASIREGNVAALSALRRCYGVDISYLGPAEKRDFARRLAARGLDARSVDFAILNPERCPNDTGSNRNALLLSTVGECTLQVDDDTVCRVMPWIAKREGVRFTSKFNPTEFAFMDEEGRLPEERFESRDFFALHETLLGKSAGELIQRHGLETRGFEQPRATLFRRIEGGGARIAMTALGVAGDSGMGSSVLFLQLEGESRASLMRSESVYRNALSYHRLIRAAPQLTVVDQGYCMTLNLGLDNRRLLPPFMPVQRLEDDIFAALLRAWAEGSAFGFLPWALSHEPPPRKRLSPADRSAQISSAQIIVALIRSFSPMEAKGTERNLRALAKFLCEWGRAPLADLVEFVRMDAWRGASVQIARIEGLLQQHQRLPHFWAEDAERHIANLRAMVAMRNYVVPFDLAEAFGPELAMERAQRLAFRLGALLEAWPDLRQAASEERASGNPIGRPI
jgi:hypothetical protein